LFAGAAGKKLDTIFFAVPRRGAKLARRPPMT